MRPCVHELLPSHIVTISAHGDWGLIAPSWQGWCWYPPGMLHALVLQTLEWDGPSPG